MINLILLATDGSAAAEHATRYAASLATKYNARVVVLHAFHALPEHLGEPNYSQAMYRTLDQASAVTDKAVAALQAAGITQLESEYVEGSPVDVILNAVNVRRPDVLVLGSRGLGTWKGAILGSVSSAIVQRCECPVLVIK
ncbi:MAG: universal stress protein [Anaerolineae bacterium]|nr:universal stress protein [Anaerolineae bacterium]